jgi:hypothetical protein
MVAELTTSPPSEAMAAVITTSPSVKTYTLEEFWELPDPPDGSKLELIVC